MGFWTGPKHPNGTADAYPAAGCGIPGGKPTKINPKTKPCLFDIEIDPTEHNDLNVNPSAATTELVAQMEKKYAAYCAGFFQSSHIFIEEERQDHPNCTTLPAFAEAHRGFRGPICT